MTKHKQAKKRARLKDYKKRRNIHRNNVATPVHEQEIPVISPRTARGKIVEREIGGRKIIHFMQIGDKKIKVKDRKPDLILPKSKKYNNSKNKRDDSDFLGHLPDEKPSRTFLGLCANEECKNKRRGTSKFCQDCSDNFNKIN